MAASPLTVLYMLSGLAIEGPLGGPERLTAALVQALDPRVIKPVVCGLWDYGTPYDQKWVKLLRNQGIETFLAAPWQEHRPLQAFFNAYQQVKKTPLPRVDIIHSQSQFGDVMALLLKRSLGARCLVRSVHEEVEWIKRPARRLLLTHFYLPARFDCEIGISDEIARRLNRRPVARMLGRQSPAIYNSVHIERIEQRSRCDRAAKRQSLGIPPGASLVCSIGRLATQKGYAILLQAAAQIKAARPDIYFVIAGEGPERARFEALHQQLGLGNTLRFLGAREDPEEIISAADLLVQASLWEGLPTVIMESMVIGTPVAATALPGMRQLIGDNQRGWLTPVHDPDGLAQGILQALEADASTKAERTRQAGIYIRTHYSIERVAAQHTALYQYL